MIFDADIHVVLKFWKIIYFYKINNYAVTSEILMKISKRARKNSPIFTYISQQTIWKLWVLFFFIVTNFYKCWRKMAKKTAVVPCVKIDDGPSNTVRYSQRQTEQPPRPSGGELSTLITDKRRTQYLSLISRVKSLHNRRSPLHV